MKKQGAETCPKCKPHDIGYCDFFEDAKMRTKAGERQRKCSECGKYRWPDEFRPTP